VRAEPAWATARPSATCRRPAAALLCALAIGAAGVTGCGSASEAPGRTISIVIPPGTAAKVARGEDPGVIPNRITGNVGDTLRIANRDRSAHRVGPFSVDAGQVLSLPLRRPGRFVGECTVHPSKGVAIIVKERSS